MYFLITALLLSLGQIISDIYLPLLPSIAIYILGFAASQLFYGPLSDGIGRRRPLIAGLSFCLIGSIICFVASDINVLLLGGFIQGIGAGATLRLPSAILGDTFEAEKLAKYSSFQP